MDTEQDFEDFAKKYPDLMAKSQQEYLGVSKGWYHILDVLFAMLSRRVESARSTLKYALENPDQKYTHSIAELEAKLTTALEQLPTITQIKEKFGGLRFYTNGVDTEFNSYISFAESMSLHTCEICGSPGTTSGDGWMKTLCKKHHDDCQAGIPIFDE